MSDPYVTHLEQLRHVVHENPRISRWVIEKRPERLGASAGGMWVAARAGEYALLLPRDPEHLLLFGKLVAQAEGRGTAAWMEDIRPRI